jgi:hypothetical protein
VSEARDTTPYSRASGPSSGTRRGRTRALRIGPVSSQAAPTRPPQALEQHAAQHLPNHGVPAIEARQFGNGERPLAVAPRSGQVEARQFVEWAGEDGGPLSAGGGVSGSRLGNISREPHHSVRSVSALLS